MSKTVKILIGLYVLSAVLVWALFPQEAGPDTGILEELATTKNMLLLENAKNADLTKKIVDARTNAAFLSLALCPTLEATDKTALCVKNGNEWLSQTILYGTALTDPAAKTKMDSLLVALGAKTKPTAKQLYETLKPVETAALEALVKSLE